jgi:O-antigen ligase
MTEKLFFTIEYKWRQMLINGFGAEPLGRLKCASYFDNIVLLPLFYIFYDYLLRFSGRATMIVQLWDELALFFFIFLMAFDLNKDYRPKRWKIPVALFLLSGIAGIAASGYFGRSTVDGYRLIFQPVLWGIYFIHIFSRESTRTKAVDVLITIGTFISIHAIMQIMFKVPMRGNWVDTTDVISLRAFSILGSPNSLGSILIMHIGFLTGLVWAEKSKHRRTIYILCEAIALVALYFTYSRGAILALIVSMVILLMINNKRLLLYLSFLGAGLILLIDKGAYRFYNLVSPDTISNMMKDGRLSKWAYAFGEFLKNPAFGKGYGQFGGSIAIKYGITNFYTDNFYLKTLVENGLFGLIAFILFAAYFIFQFAREGKNRVQMGISIALIAFLLHNFVDNLYGIPVLTFYYYVYFAMGISMLNDTAREVA